MSWEDVSSTNPSPSCAGNVELCRRQPTPSAAMNLLISRWKAFNRRRVLRSLHGVGVVGDICSPPSLPLMPLAQNRGRYKAEM
jgi:hypothetical protein